MQEFIETLAERCDLSKADANRAVHAILDSLTETMADGEEVNFIGFGKFLSHRRRAREAVNPQDPTKKIKVRAANVPKFRPGKGLREAVAELPVIEDASATSSGSAASGNGAERASGGGTTTSAEAGEWRPLADRR